MKRHVERVCHQIAGLAHIAMARGDITHDELAAKLEAMDCKITPIQLDDILRAMFPDLGAREMAELFFAMDTKLSFQVAKIEAPTDQAEPE